LIRNPRPTTAIFIRLAVISVLTVSFGCRSPRYLMIPDGGEAEIPGTARKGDSCQTTANCQSALTCADKVCLRRSPLCQCRVRQSPLET
jgi:hypothetical protein